MCLVCEKVSDVVRSVNKMGRWSDDRSVCVLHVIDCDMLGEQKAMSGEVRPKPA